MGRPWGIQGPNARRALQRLRRHESRNVTFVAPDGSWPIVWKRARGTRVEDADGRSYLDLTAAFGVAAAGHANRAVIRAARRQMNDLLHAMGDVHPHPLKGDLARELSRLTFERWRRGFARSPFSRREARAKTIFCNSGFEAVEAALKTAALATGRSEIIAFEQGYHGVGYGALNATHRPLFRAPFLSQIAQFGRFLPFPQAAAELPGVAAQLESCLASERIGAVLAEPVQVRGGIRIPPLGFLKELRRLCSAAGALLIVDEIYTGFGRTGKWFACEHSSVAPDLICLGKALTGGFPLSACVGPAELMDQAWPASQGEAVHTSTFLGHPVGCAMALAQINEIRKRRLPEAAAQRGVFLARQLARLEPPAGLALQTRALGLLAGIELSKPDGAPATGQALRAVTEMLAAGFILLPEGPAANVLSLTPPLIISEAELARALNALRAAFQKI